MGDNTVVGGRSSLPELAPAYSAGTLARRRRRALVFARSSEMPPSTTVVCILWLHAVGDIHVFPMETSTFDHKLRIQNTYDLSLV